MNTRNWETTVKDGDYFISELREAFEQVEDMKNWKNPIDAVIHWSDRKIVEAAIIHFTGSVPTFTKTSAGHLWVKAAGYYSAIGA